MMDLPKGQEWVFHMVNNILIEVLGTIAEQERETIRKRQAEGIEAAKAKGKKFGRPALAFPANWGHGICLLEIWRDHCKDRHGTDRHKAYQLV